jgi:hypothetical protein
MRAFTLIETIVYIGLYGLLMTGLISGAVALRATAERNDSEAFLFEEGMYLLETFDHSVSSGLIPESINSDGAEVNSLSIIKTVSGDGFPYVDISFTLATHASDGTMLQRSFSERSYSTSS